MTTASDIHVFKDIKTDTSLDQNTRYPISHVMLPFAYDFAIPIGVNVIHATPILAQ